jgi:hypothetical protein
MKLSVRQIDLKLDSSAVRKGRRRNGIFYPAWLEHLGSHFEALALVRLSVLLPPTVPGWLYWMRIVPWGSSTFVTMPLVIGCCAKAAELRTVRAAAAAKKNMLFFISASVCKNGPVEEQSHHAL